MKTFNQVIKWHDRIALQQRGTMVGEEHREMSEALDARIAELTAEVDRLEDELRNEQHALRLADRANLDLSNFAILATKWMETAYRDSDYKLSIPPIIEGASTIAKDEYETLYKSYDDARKQIDELKAESSRYRSALEEISDPLGFDWSTKPEIDCANIARNALKEGV